MPVSSASNFRLELERPPAVESYTRLQGNCLSLVQFHLPTGGLNVPSEKPRLAFSPASSLWHRVPGWFLRAKQSCVGVTVFICLSPAAPAVLVCTSLLLFTFSFVEKTENHSAKPTVPVSPAPAHPKSRSKPKPKKTPELPKGASAGAGPKGDEVPPSKKYTKPPGKQAPTPPPKPSGRSTTRETGEYAPRRGESRVLSSGVGLVGPLGPVAFGCLL